MNVDGIDVLYLHDAEEHFDDALRLGDPRWALDEFLPTCMQRGVSVVAAGVFNSGILATPRPQSRVRFEYATATAELLRRAHRIADVCEAHGVMLPAAAIAFPMQHPAVASVVLGMRSADEVRRNLAAYQAEVPAQVWSDLRTEGSLDARAPLPKQDS